MDKAGKSEIIEARGYLIKKKNRGISPFNYPLIFSIIGIQDNLQGKGVWRQRFGMAIERTMLG